MSGLTLRRRLQRRFVRFQARLEAGTGDRVLPLVIALGLAFILGWVGLARLRGGATGTDLAGYVQAVWLLSEGKIPQASLFGDRINMFGIHWSFVVYPLAAPARLLPIADVLIVVQSLALGAAVIPLWWLARRAANLRVGAASALCLAYALHPSVHSLALDDFNPETLAIPGFIAVAYFGSAQRWVWYWISVVFVLACRADFGLILALWGLLMVGEGRRRPGLWTTGVAAAWSLGLLLIVQPLFSGPAVRQYGDYGDSFGEAIVEMATNPLDTLGDLTSSANEALLVGLLAPVLFLPLLSLRYLLPALPMSAMYLVTADVTESYAERNAVLVAFVFIAGTRALARLGTMGVDRVFVDTRLLMTLVVASLLLFIDASPSSPYERPWNWGERTELQDVIAEAAATIDPADAVRASPSALLEMAERPWLYPLSTQQQPQVVSTIYRVRTVLIVESDLPPLDAEARAVQRSTFHSGMAAQGFELRFAEENHGVWVFFRP